MPLVLSLFPGIGLLDMAFEEEGFTVVRGPDLLWGGDVKRFHPPAGKFDGVIGGPPCQIFSMMKRLNPRAGEKHGNLIPEFERVVAEARPEWFLMENVQEAPWPKVDGYEVQWLRLRDVWVGGDTNRMRAFSWGYQSVGDEAARRAEPMLRAPRLEVTTLALHRPDPAPSVLAGGMTAKALRRAKPRSGPGAGPRIPMLKLLAMQGLPETFFDESPLTIEGQRHMLGNGVPLPMGRAVARAVKAALGMTTPARPGAGESAP